MPKCAHIYAFVQRSSKVSPTKRLFYVGSSIEIHERLVTHMECLFKAQSLSKPTEVYGYINSHVGDGNLPFWIDNVLGWTQFWLNLDFLWVEELNAIWGLKCE